MRGYLVVYGIHRNRQCRRQRVGMKETRRCTEGDEEEGLWIAISQQAEWRAQKED